MDETINTQVTISGCEKRITHFKNSLQNSKNFQFLIHPSFLINFKHIKMCIDNFAFNCVNIRNF
jgi:hypothetical protein